MCKNDIYILFPVTLTFGSQNYLTIAFTRVRSYYSVQDKLSTAFQF